MCCKCGAKTFKDHKDKCASGYPAHVYKGSFSTTRDDE